MIMSVICAIVVAVITAGIFNAFYVMGPESMNGGAGVRFWSYISEIGGDNWAKSLIFGGFVGLVNYLTKCRGMVEGNYLFGLIAGVVIFIAALVPFVVITLWWWDQGTTWREVLPFIGLSLIFTLTAMAASELLIAALGLGTGSVLVVPLELAPIIIGGVCALSYLGKLLLTELSKE